LLDGEAKTACQQACAGDAIVFGNVNDKTSQISRVRAENPQRSFMVLEQLHVLPNVTYLSKVRNTDEIIEPKGHHAAAPAAHDSKEPMPQSEHH
jgi:molybdopterin-containing oxidoreductase family iron-sulfur binding subunit